MKASIGTSQTNLGLESEYTENKFVLDRSRKCHLIDVVPMGAVRMTVSDKWKTIDNKNPKYVQRPAVTRYFAFKTRVKETCEEVGFVLKNHLEVVFFIPMPESWSKKKKERMNGLPHKTRPDVDNIIKGLMDSLKEQDGDVWSVNMKKYYAHKGSILIYE